LKRFTKLRPRAVQLFLLFLLIILYGFNKGIFFFPGGSNSPAPEGLNSNYDGRNRATVEEVYGIKLEKALITRVVDGDTAYAMLEGGREEKVRFIGVDAPESTVKQEVYEEEATRFTKTHLEGRAVYLERDVRERDKYGRLLRYVWLRPPLLASEGEIRAKMFNAMLILRGYALSATYPPDVKYAAFFARFQEEARRARRGLWVLEKKK